MYISIFVGLILVRDFYVSHVAPRSVLKYVVSRGYSVVSAKEIVCQLVFFSRASFRAIIGAKRA